MFVTQKQLLQLVMFWKLASLNKNLQIILHYAHALESKTKMRNCGIEIFKKQHVILARKYRYVNSRNKKVKERQINYYRYGNCINHCNQRLPDARRDELLFHDYWKLAEWQRQRDYTANHVMRKQTKRKTKKDSRRKQTFSYFYTANDQKIKVCKAIFLKTLGIGEKTVSYTLEHQVGMGHASKEGRGRQPPSNKIPNSKRESVRQHINSFPAMESYYARSKYKDQKNFYKNT